MLMFVPKSQRFWTHKEETSYQIDFSAVFSKFAMGWTHFQGTLEFLHFIYYIQDMHKKLLEKYTNIISWKYMCITIRMLIQKPFNLIVSLAFAVNAARYSGVPRDILLMPSQTHETAL